MSITRLNTKPETEEFFTISSSNVDTDKNLNHEPSCICFRDKYKKVLDELLGKTKDSISVKDTKKNYSDDVCYVILVNGKPLFYTFTKKEAKKKIKKISKILLLNSENLSVYKNNSYDYSIRKTLDFILFTYSFTFFEIKCEPIISFKNKNISKYLRE